jgi:hypothetical protein
VGTAHPVKRSAVGGEAWLTHPTAFANEVAPAFVKAWEYVEVAALAKEIQIIV